MAEIMFWFFLTLGWIGIIYFLYLIKLDDKLHKEIMNDLISNTDILDELKNGEVK